MMAVDFTRATMCVTHWWLVIQLAEVIDLGGQYFLKLTDKVESGNVGMSKWGHSKND